MAAKSMEGRMVKLETNIDYIKEEMTAIHKKLDNFIDCAPGKFANKDVEKRVEKLEENLNKTTIDITRETAKWAGVWVGASGLVILIISFLLNKFG